MKYVQEALSETEFWQIKKEIDKEVERIGWSKEKCIAYIENRYHVSSRLVMTDDQLIHFKTYLVNLPNKKAAIAPGKKLLKNRLKISGCALPKR